MENSLLVIFDAKSNTLYYIVQQNSVIYFDDFIINLPIAKIKIRQFFLLYGKSLLYFYSMLKGHGHGSASS